MHFLFESGEPIEPIKLDLAKVLHEALVHVRRHAGQRLGLVLPIEALGPNVRVLTQHSQLVALADHVLDHRTRGHRGGHGLDRRVLRRPDACDALLELIKVEHRACLHRRALCNAHLAHLLRVHEGGLARGDREPALDVRLARRVSRDLAQLLHLPHADQVLRVQHAQPVLKRELVRDHI